MLPVSLFCCYGFLRLIDRLSLKSSLWLRVLLEEFSSLRRLLPKRLEFGTLVTLDTAQNAARFPLFLWRAEFVSSIVFFGRVLLGLGLILDNCWLIICCTPCGLFRSLSGIGNNTECCSFLACALFFLCLGRRLCRWESSFCLRFLASWASLGHRFSSVTENCLVLKILLMYCFLFLAFSFLLFFFFSLHSLVA